MSTLSDRQKGIFKEYVDCKKPEDAKKTEEKKEDSK